MRNNKGKKACLDGVIIVLGLVLAGLLALVLSRTDNADKEAAVQVEIEKISDDYHSLEQIEISNTVTEHKNKDNVNESDEKEHVVINDEQEKGYDEKQDSIADDSVQCVKQTKDISATESGETEIIKGSEKEKSEETSYDVTESVDVKTDSDKSNVDEYEGVIELPIVPVR